MTADGTGLLTADAIVFPLTRRHLLVLYPHRPTDDGLTRRPPSAKLARAANQIVALNARRSVFHHPGEDPTVGIHLPDGKEEAPLAFDGVRPEDLVQRWSQSG